MAEPIKKPAFILEDGFIEECISRLPPAPDLATVSVALKRDQRVGDAFGDDWICQICKYVVWVAQQCGECEKLVCKKCIDDSLIKSPKCPGCPADFKSVKVARAASSHLATSSLTCVEPGCGRTFGYLAAAAHLADHAAASY